MVPEHRPLCHQVVGALGVFDTVTVGRIANTAGQGNGAIRRGFLNQLERQRTVAVKIVRRRSQSAGGAGIDAAGHGWHQADLDVAGAAPVLRVEGVPRHVELEGFDRILVETRQTRHAQPRRQVLGHVDDSLVRQSAIAEVHRRRIPLVGDQDLELFHAGSEQVRVRDYEAGIARREEVHPGNVVRIVVFVLVRDFAAGVVAIDVEVAAGNTGLEDWRRRFGRLLIRAEIRVFVEDRCRQVCVEPRQNRLRQQATTAIDRYCHAARPGRRCAVGRRNAVSVSQKTVAVEVENESAANPAALEIEFVEPVLAVGLIRIRTHDGRIDRTEEETRIAHETAAEHVLARRHRRAPAVM